METKPWNLMEYLKNFEWEALLVNLVTTVVILLAAILIWFVLSRALKALEKGKTSASLLLPLRLMLRYAVIIVAFLLILSSYGVPIGNFWTFVSTVVGLVAIGFVAVWSVLSNFSATFFLMMVQPFKVGDYVRVVGDDVMGRVVDINFMFTTIRKGTGDTYKVPNNQFFQKSILRPVDPEKLEKQGEDDKEDSKSNESPHKDQNLEGIRMPQAPRGAK